MAGASGTVAFKRQGQPHCPHAAFKNVVRPGHFSVHPPSRCCRARLLLAALAEDKRQHPAVTRVQHQPPRRGDIKTRRIALDLKDQRRQPVAARRLVSRPHGTLQIARFDNRQTGRIQPVLGEAGREKSTAIDARGGIGDPDNAPASTAIALHGAGREPKHEACRRPDVARQRAAHFMQSTAGKSALKTVINRAGTQWQLRRAFGITKRHPPVRLIRLGLIRTGALLQDIGRGLQSRETHA